MKKFCKFCGILILILVILGLGLWGIGAVTAGTDGINELLGELTNDRIQMDLQGIQVSIGEALEENAIYDIDESNMFDKKYEIREGDVEKTKVADNTITSLEIELGGCMFELKDSKDASYYVEYNGKGKSQAFVKGDTLYVKVLNGNEWNVISWNADENDNCMTLYIPVGTALAETEIELGAGQMKLDNLKVQDLKIDLGAGQILANQLQAENAALSIGAGEIRLVDAQLGNVQAEVGAGNCEISGNVAGDIEAECAMGNMLLELEDAEQNFNYEIQCVTGNIEIGDSKYSGVSQEQSINNGASKNIDLECAMGNIEVKFY